MKESILEKISALVTKGIELESECIYMLAQIRKYIEQQRIAGYWNLLMCANCALHSQLDNRTVQGFLRELNDLLINAEAQGRYNTQFVTSSRISRTGLIKDYVASFGCVPDLLCDASYK